MQQVYIYIYYRKSTFHYESDRMCSISGSEYMEESIYEESDDYISFNKQYCRLEVIPKLE